MPIEKGALHLFNFTFVFFPLTTSAMGRKHKEKAYV